MLNFMKEMEVMEQKHFYEYLRDYDEENQNELELKLKINLNFEIL